MLTQVQKGQPMHLATNMTRKEFLRNLALASSALLPGWSFAAATEGEAPGLPRVEPGALGMDARRLQLAYDLMERWTTGPNPAVPGASMLVGRHGKTVAPRRFGRQGPEADAEPIRNDAMFYMASVTKPL